MICFNANDMFKIKITSTQFCSPVICVRKQHSEFLEKSFARLTFPVFTSKNFPLSEVLRRVNQEVGQIR